jgi:pantoate--beta-alanine ligase
MQLIHTVKEMQAFSDNARSAAQKIAVVPTMGALHKGHLALIKKAKSVADIVIVTIFVNPTQFGANEDFSKYPRTLESDCKLLEPYQIAAVFCPLVTEIYPPHDASWVEVVGMDKNLCGKYRPGHFKGVSTVVARLFNITKPHFGVFGLKDIQQFQILSRMTQDLHFGIEMVGVETLREASGLAMSSRNVYLSAEERVQATVLFQALQLAKAEIEKGERDFAIIQPKMEQLITTAPLAKIQYIEAVSPHDLGLLAHFEGQQKVIIAVAVYFGSTRLIDNIIVNL